MLLICELLAIEDHRVAARFALHKRHEQNVLVRLVGLIAVAADIDNCGPTPVGSSRQRRGRVPDATLARDRGIGGPGLPPSFGGARCWEPVIAPLEAAGHTVDAPDLPGCGADHTPVEAVTLANYAKRVCDVQARSSGGRLRRVRWRAGGLWLWLGGVSGGRAVGFVGSGRLLRPASLELGSELSDLRDVRLEIGVGDRTLFGK